MIDPPWIKPLPAMRLGAPLPIREADASFLRDAAIFKIVVEHDLKLSAEFLNRLQADLAALTKG
jgi:hypothetical protein